jgi:DNA-binding NtrC family response regulator
MTEIRASLSHWRWARVNRVVRCRKSTALKPSPFPSVPFVVITGFPDTEMAVNLLKQGVVDYVPKPIDSEKLLDVVAKAMARRTSLKE